MSHPVRYLLPFALLLTLSPPGINSARAQETAVEMTFGSFDDAVTEAKRNKKPLVVFGMVDT